MTMKQVRFDFEKNTVHETYTVTEYDRHSIKSILYKKCFNRISDEDWDNMLKDLNTFKLTEMTVHKDSIKNIKLS